MWLNGVGVYSSEERAKQAAEDCVTVAEVNGDVFFNDGGFSDKKIKLKDLSHVIQMPVK